MDHDTFEIRATIKRMEKENSRYAIGSFLLSGAYFWFYGDSLARSEHAISLLIILVGCFIANEVRQSRLDVLRASLRQVLIAKNPSILTSTEW